jgi:zinc and cadmium transporter
MPRRGCDGGHLTPGVSVTGAVWTRCLTAVAIVSAIPLLTIGSLAIDERQVRRAVPVMVQLAIGALMGAVVFDLIPDALAAGRPPRLVALGVVGGVLAFLVFDRLLHRGHATSGGALVTLNLTGDLVHNAVDGMLIAAGFLTDPTLGVVTTVAVSMHELPREMGSFGVFVHGGLSMRRAVAYNAVTGLAAFSGAIIAMLAGTMVQGVAIALLPVAAGTFVYLASVLFRSAVAARRDAGGGWLPFAAWITVGAAVTGLLHRLS